MTNEGAGPSRVLLIDLSSLFWTAWHSSSSDAVSEAKSRTLTGVQRCIAAVPQGSLVAICCDSGRSWRKDLLPGYKAQRPEKSHASLGELDKVRERLTADGLLLWGAPTFEADDVIATACEAAFASGHPVTIASADKDLLQLVRPGVNQMRTHDWSTWDFAMVVEKFGVEPAQLGDWLALVGDKSDNITGAPGIGPKSATALLQDNGDLKALYRRLMAGEPVTTPAATKSLRENGDAVDLARKLVSLRSDAPIKFEEIYQRREPAKLVPQEETDMDAQDTEFEEAAPPQDAPKTEVTPTPDVKPPGNGNGNGHASVALVPVKYELALEPTSLGTAHKLAIGLYESRLYQRYNTVEAIWAVIIRGREMGLGALTALDCFHVIEGKPAPHAMLIIARAKDDPDCEYFQCVETNGERATWETKHRRNPQPTRLTYTLKQADAAGLLRESKSGKPSNWHMRPDEMLRKTAGVQLARMEYPSASLGLYAAEELNGEAA